MQNIFHDAVVADAIVVILKDRSLLACITGQLSMGISLSIISSCSFSVTASEKGCNPTVIFLKKKMQRRRHIGFRSLHWQAIALQT